MPNHCYNILTITGERKELEKLKDFVKAADDQPFSFEKILPFPKEDWKHNGKTKENYTTHGYSWCCDTWGTKWDAYDFNDSPRFETKETLVYEFFTAWCPPTKTIDALAKKYSKLKLRLYSEEAGMGFVVLTEWAKGTRTNDQEWSDDLPAELKYNLRGG